jgi:CheY-like chemotaxis protein
MNTNSILKPVEILLVEDNPGDVRLTLEGLKETRVSSNLSVVRDGVEAMSFLRREGEYANAPRPALILLDLNLPKRDGRDVLARIKADDTIKRIPVVVFTSSAAEQDVHKAYGLHANCYIIKPVELDQFMKAVKSIGDFWLSLVRLPRGERNGA